MKVVFRSIWVLGCLLSLSSCGEYMRLQQSTDVMEKYTAAREYFDNEDYPKAVNLLEVSVPYLQSTKDGEYASFLLGLAYYKDKQYGLATKVFQNYYKRYPNGTYSEQARYMAGVGLAEALPDPRLDQGATYTAIKELQLFLDYFPQSEKREEVIDLLFKLQENLAYKELLNVQLYYNMGYYIFNNYESAIVTARNAMKDYPYSQYKETMHYYVMASLYEIAKLSVEEKRLERLRNLRDEYYNYINEFPEGVHKEQVKEYFDYAEKYI